MASMDEIKEGVKAAMEGYIGKAPGNSSLSEGKSPSASSTSSPDIASFVSTLKTFGQAFIPAIAGINSFADSTHAASNTMKAIASKLPIGSGIAGDIVEKIDTGRAQNAEAGKIGIGGSIPQLGEQAARAGMTVDDFTKTLGDANGTLNGFGSTAAGVAENYASVTQEALESEQGRQLIRNGMTSSEMQRYVQLAGLNSKANLSELADRQKLAKSATELATQIDATSRITGKSRDSITDEMSSRDKSAEGILTLNLMSKEQQDQYHKTEGALSGMGDSIQKAALNMASGEALTDDTINTLGALGTAGTEFQNAIAQQQAATTDAEKASAAAALEKAKADIVAYTSSKEYAQLALSGGSEINEQQKKLAVETNAYAQSMKGVTDKFGVTGVQAGEIATKTAGAAQKGETVTGERIAGAELTSAINEGYEGSRKAAVAAAVGVNEYNVKLGENKKVLDEVANAFKFLGDSSKTSAQMKDSATKTISDAKEAVFGEDKAPTTPSSKLSGHIPGTPLEPLKRQSGSFGATGSLLEDFSKYGTEGAPAMLHGKEGVITEAQLKQLASNKFSQETVGGSDIEKPSNTKPTVNKESTTDFGSFDAPEARLDFSTISKEASSMFKGIELPDFSSISKEASSMFKGIELPDFSSISKEASSMFGNIQMPDFSSISKEASSMFGNIQMPDFDSVVGQMKPPDFSKLPIFDELNKASTNVAPPPVEQPVPVEKPVAQTEQIGIKDLYDVLIDLNTNIMQMVSHTEAISDSSSKTAGYASESTGSRV